MPRIVHNGQVFSSTGSPAVTLSQAQYNALSTEEKNNGTLYFIVDAKTSIGDIDDVNLSTPAVGDTLTWNGTNWVNSKQYITHKITTNSDPLIVHIGAYGAAIVLGFIQGIGGVAVLIRITNHAIQHTVDMYSGGAFSNQYVTFTYDSTNDNLTIKPATGDNYITVVTS